MRLDVAGEQVIQRRRAAAIWKCCHLMPATLLNMTPARWLALPSPTDP